MLLDCRARSSAVLAVAFHCTQIFVLTISMRHGRAQVDTNRGGTIDATEFAAWLSRMEERCWEREEAGIQVRRF